MTFKEKVNLLLTEALVEKPSLFLIDLTITDAFKVIIT
jgi:ribosome maturation factor RimP